MNFSIEIPYSVSQPIAKDLSMGFSPRQENVFNLDPQRDQSKNSLVNFNKIEIRDPEVKEFVALLED